MAQMSGGGVAGSRGEGSPGPVSPSGYRRPVVYGTRKYHQLWEMAKSVPEVAEPDAEEGEDGGLGNEASQVVGVGGGEDEGAGDSRDGEADGGHARVPALERVAGGINAEDSVRSVPVSGMEVVGDLNDLNDLD